MNFCGTRAAKQSGDGMKFVTFRNQKLPLLYARCRKATTCLLVFSCRQLPSVQE